MNLIPIELKALFNFDSKNPATMLISGGLLFLLIGFISLFSEIGLGVQSVWYYLLSVLSILLGFVLVGLGIGLNIEWMKGRKRRR